MLNPITPPPTLKDISVKITLTFPIIKNGFNQKLLLNLKMTQGQEIFGQKNLNLLQLKIKSSKKQCMN